MRSRGHQPPVCHDCQAKQQEWFKKENSKLNQEQRKKLQEELKKIAQEQCEQWTELISTMQLDKLSQENRVDNEDNYIPPEYFVQQDFIQEMFSDQI